MSDWVQPSAEEQLEFLQNLQRLFEEGDFTATYKYALLMALAEIAVESGDDSGAPLPVEISAIAEKFAEFYWRQSAPYMSRHAWRGSRDPLAKPWQTGRHR